MRGGAHKVFRRFLKFSQFFYRNFSKIVASSSKENENCVVHLKGVHSEKSRKPRENRSINRDTKHVRIIHPSNESAPASERDKTRSSADADNRLDAFSGQSRSTNMVPFHM